MPGGDANVQHLVNVLQREANGEHAVQATGWRGLLAAFTLSQGPRGFGGTAGRKRLRRLVAGAAAVAAGLTLAGTPAFADGIRSQQWYLSAMKVADAQAAANGGDGVTVAVL